MRTPRALLCCVFLCMVHLGHSHPAPSRVLREQVQFALWHDGDRDDLKPVGTVTRLVQQANPGLVLTVRALPPGNMLHQLQQWCSQDNAGLPDIVIIPDRWLPTFAHALQPINALVDARKLHAYPEPVRDCLRHAGRLYGVPWVVRSRALFYRTDLFQSAGVLPPKSWNDTLVAARRCHRPPDVYGFGLPGIRDDSGARALLHMLWSQGGDLPPVGDPSRTNLPALESALGLFRDLHTASEPEVLAWDQASLEAFFADGRLAMVLADSGFEQFLAAEAPDLPWATTTLPSGSYAVGHIGVDVACILKTTRHLEASVKVITALLGVESSEARLALGGVPARSDLRAKLRLEPRYAAYIGSMDTARSLPNDRWDAAQAVLSDGLFLLLTGRRSVGETRDFIASTLSGPAPAPPGS